MISPALQYYGGKWACADKIISLFPAHKTFVDVFCGGASITLKKSKSKNEIINDINGEITNFFSVMRDRNSELKAKLELTPYSRDEYYNCREQSGDSLEQARRTAVKSWFGFGDSMDNETGFRVTISQGGSLTRPWLSYVDNLGLYSDRLRGVVIENLDWREMITRYDKSDTLFYFDPPYLLSTRAKQHGYAFDWKDEDHDHLLEALDSIQGKFFLSGYLGGPYESLKFRRLEFLAGTQSKTATEYVWTNHLDEQVCMSI